MASHMKRLRDDVFSNSQIKRPFGSSRGESYGQPPVPGGGEEIAGGVGAGGGGGGASSAQKLTTNDALTYLKEVKDMFQDQREKYDMFLDVMKDFKAQRYIIFGRKKRFQNDDHVYKSFLDILNMYRKEHKGINEVYHEVKFYKLLCRYFMTYRIMFHFMSQLCLVSHRLSSMQVATLFDDHPDLLDEFTRFLPDASAAASAHHASFLRQSYHRYDERSSVMAQLRHTQMDKQRGRRDRIIPPQGERDLNVESPDMDEDKSMVKLHKEQRKRAEKESRDRRTRDQDFKEPDIDANRDMHRLEKRKSARKVEDFGVHSGLAPYDDKDALKSMYSQEFTFCENVKNRLRNPDDYQAFLKCLHIYSTEIITRKELQSLVSDLLGKHPDLMEGFSAFLERCENIDGFLAGVMDKKAFGNEGHVSKSTRTEEKEREHRRETDAAKEDMYKEKYWGKSIQELDLSNCQRCTASYRLLPDDYPIPSVSQRSELGSQVLNDLWVSVTSGSEDYSFKHMRKNQYEESLFELDMLLESVSSTAKRAEDLLNSINNKSINSEVPIRIEEHFTALDLRCIERLYGDHGLDVMDILRRNPALALPVILTRLKQKQEDWTKCRSDFNKVWAEIYAKNHYKSLDHRSFYFKQQDSKNLSTKSSLFLALVTEIKEIKEKGQKDDDVLLSIAAGSRHYIVPNLEFEFTDKDIHEDLLKLIKYSCEEICTTKEQLNKVLRLWTTFLEPILDVPSRPQNVDGAEDAELSSHGAPKTASLRPPEINGSPGADDATMNLKQSKPDCNGVQTTSPDKVDPSKNSLVNGDALAKEDRSRTERDFKSTVAGDKVSNSNGSWALAARATDSGPASQVLADLIMLRMMVMKPMANGDFAEVAKVKRHTEDSAEPSKIEKEEGELSPNGDFDEVNFGAYGDNGSRANTKHSVDPTHYRAGVGRIDADADDEDSVNVSEGMDVSGSESAADECSREDHEEDGDRDDLDGKAESEGEAEGIEDANFVGENGTSLPPSEHFLLTAKPLAKRVASPLCDGERKDSHLQIVAGDEMDNKLLQLYEYEKSRKPEKSKRQFSDLDEASAMEGADVINGLEYKMSCSSSKISYVLDTEDYFFRIRRKRRKLSGSGSSSSRSHAKVERFHSFLSGSV
ncbi:Histone deacetylase interacting [Cynara cardunculus var. scolymus]|uniref:Histone deacetylase interacting n=1 Tax=Cynara cardunculus var. scolymus TaxID=59895 RepID=A0A103Y4Q2_CYNCS|nr:Histone deacetylase interacting [Cynara cardunculus var. scolymus]